MKQFLKVHDAPIPTVAVRKEITAKKNLKNVLHQLNIPTGRSIRDFISEQLKSVHMHASRISI